MMGHPAFLLLCGIASCCFISYNLVRMPVLSLFAQSLGAGPEAIGFVISASTLTGVVLKLPSGALSDIYGRRVLLRIGIVAFALPPFAYPFVHDLSTLTALRFLHGMATAVYVPSALATVADLFKERRGAALGWYTASTQAGGLIGPVLGGWIAYAAGFTATFLTAGAFGLTGLLLFVALRLGPAPPRPHEAGLTPLIADIVTGLRLVARNRRVLVTSLTDGGSKIANGALMAFLPIYGVTAGLNASEVGLLFGVQGVTAFVSKPIMGRVSDRVGRPPLIVLGLTICATTFGLMPWVTGLLPLLLLAAGFGFGEAVVLTSTSAYIADVSELKSLGAGMGMLGTLSDIGHAGGPLLTGLLIAHLDFTQAFAVIAVIQLLTAGLFWGFARSR
jgi:MFS family permease